MSTSLEAPTAPAPADLIILRSKTKSALTVLGCVAFIAVGIVLVSIDDPEFSPIGKLTGWPAIVVFGLLLVPAVRLLLSKTPGLILQRDGFVDRSSAISAGFVPWSEVTELLVTTISGQRILTVKVRDPKPYLARGNLLQRPLVRANLRLTGSPINLSSTGLHISFEELVQRFQERCALAHAEAPPRQ